MRKTSVAAFLALLLAPAVRAQDITEDVFLAPFGEQHDAVRALMEDVTRAEAARRTAGLLPNPRFEYWRESPEANPRLTNWTLAWTPPLDGRYGLGKRAADAGLEAARERLAADRAGLRRELRQIFAAWSQSRERREILGRQSEVFARLAGQEQQRARLGEASGLAARRLALAAAEARVTLASAEADYARAEAMAHGVRPDLPAGAHPARVPLPEPPASPDIAGVPILRALEAETEQARLETRRAGRFWGFPTLQLGWQTIEDDGADASGPIVATGWTLPLFDRAQGARLEARRREEARVARLAVEKARVAGTLEGALTAYRILLAAARDAGETEADTDRVIEAATRAYAAGEAGLTDLLDSLRSAFAAKLHAIEARDRALEAHRDLETVPGRPLSGGESR